MKRKSERLIVEHCGVKFVLKFKRVTSNAGTFKVVGVIDRNGNEVPPLEDERVEFVGGDHPSWRVKEEFMPKHDDQDCES